MNKKIFGLGEKFRNSLAAGAFAAAVRGAQAEERPNDHNLHLPTAELSQGSVGGEVNLGQQRKSGNLDFEPGARFR